MPRINNTLQYQTEHDGGFGLSISVGWLVPWSAAVEFKPSGPQIEDIELDGMPEVYGVVVDLAGMKYPLEVPTVIERLKIVWGKITGKPYMVSEIESAIVQQIHQLDEQHREAA